MPRRPRRPDDSARHFDYDSRPDASPLPPEAPTEPPGYFKDDDPTIWPGGYKPPEDDLPHTGDTTYFGSPPLAQSSEETREISATAPQIQKTVDHLRNKLELGQIAEGNIELAALLGHTAAQVALGRKPSRGMPVEELIQFLLTDPNLKIRIDVG